MEEVKAGLGKRSVRLLTTLSVRGKNIFTAKDAAGIMNNGRNNVNNMLYQLVNKRWLQRLEKGKYLILPLESGLKGKYLEHRLIIAPQLISPYYISYESALKYYGYTEQVSRTLTIATTKRKKELRVNGDSYRFIRVIPYKFFGFKKVWFRHRELNVAEREKLILDCLDRLDACGGIVEAAKGLWQGKDELSFPKVIKYAGRMRNRALLQRLGFLMELYAIRPNFLETVRSHISGSYTLLDNTLPPRGRYVERWKVRVNIPEEKLKSFK